MAVTDEINRVKFVSEDFATYRSEADQFFSSHYPNDFNNLLATDLGNALMDQLAFAMQALTFSINRRSSELFLSTARLNKSITKLARMLGYPISPGSPASCDLTLTLSQAYTFPVTIPVGFQFYGPGGVVYEHQANLDYIIAPGVTTATIPVREGTTGRTAYISDGSANQQFSILGVTSGEYLYSDGMVLTVDGTAWTRQDLIKYQNSNIFEVLFTDEPPKLRFGDGIAGGIPVSGSQIALIYRYGKGSRGAIGKDQLTSSQTLVINNITIPLTLSNTVSDVGGDPEDIRHVRAYASSFFRTQNAAVVKSDYDTIANLQSGVALADAQILRGISTDITIQDSFTGIFAGQQMVQSAASGIEMTSVSGLELLGVSGTENLVVSGTSNLGVSGKAGLFVGGTNSLGVSGTQYLGWNGSSITGIDKLGVSGVSVLYVGGTSGLGVSGTSQLGVDGISMLSVSGKEFVGISGKDGLVAEATSGITITDTSVSGLSAYLSQMMSDTSKANAVQVVVLSSDSNNRYISPSSLTLQNVQNTIQTISDAVVTVKAVDGISKVVNADVTVEIGINQTAVKTDVEQKSLNALTRSSSPLGLLVRRGAGVSLYKSDIENAIRDANATGDLRYVNIVINGPAQYLDGAGNLIIGRQQIVQNGTVSVKVKTRFLTSGEAVAT